MTDFAKDTHSASISLLNRFYSVFLFVAIALLTVGVPFVFLRKAACTAASVFVIVIVLLARRMSRHGQSQKSLVLFSMALWLLLVALIYGGLPPASASTAIAMSVMLAVVVRVRAGILFGGSYLAAWLLYLILRMAGLMPEPYFVGTPLTGWFISAVSIWMVLLPIPELVRHLRRSASLQHAIIEATTDGILVVNTKGIIETCNQRFLDCWRIPAAYANTKLDRTLLELVAQQMLDPETFLEKIQRLYAHPEQSSVDILLLKDGRILERHSQPQRLDERIVGRVWSFRDVTEREQAQAEIHLLAFNDPLTSLPNRRLMYDRLAQMMASCKRSGLVGALLFLDLDNFKPLNDFHGHGVGDLLLIEVAQRITRCVRQIDTVARFGGDEFVVMLGTLDTAPGDARQHASQVAEKICLALAQPYDLVIHQDTPHAEGEITHVQHRCTSSIGIAMFPEGATTPDEVLKRADSAMYSAKASGRNAVRFYGAEVAEFTRTGR